MSKKNKIFKSIMTSTELLNLALQNFNLPIFVYVELPKNI